MITNRIVLMWPLMEILTGQLIRGGRLIIQLRLEH